MGIIAIYSYSVQQDTGAIPLPEMADVMNDKIDIDQRFLCPITNELMSDPCIAFDQNTYERTAIQEFLESHGRSPVTGKKATTMLLFDNDKLKCEIEEFRNVHNL